MAKHKRSSKKGRHNPPRVLAGDARKLGLQSFRAGRFDEAIATWSGLPHQDPQLVAALAEAHFRRALTRPAAEEQIGDLRQATTLAPDDPRYHYHLGLVLHRTGDSAGAMECYRDVLQHDTANLGTGPGVMLALAALEQDAETDLSALPGSAPEVRRTLAPVQSLLRGETPPEGEDPVARLWRGLGLVRIGDGSARDVLKDTRPLPSRQATAVRTYYQGVAAAREGELEPVLRTWQELYDQGTRTPWLLQNVAALLARHLQEQDLPDVVATAQRWLPLAPSSPALGQAVVQTLDRAAQAAAETGDWARAAVLWEGARQVVSSSSSLGSPRPLLHNLALAYEAQERWLDAAEAWRAMLRTRPRGSARESAGKRSPAGAQAALDDEQWTWVRRRVIESYKRADRPDEAVTVFRQAIKADPEDLDLRLQLADALLANEQEQAAINELERLLKIDPQHVEAQLRLANAHMELGNWYKAEPIARQVVRQHPDHPGARRFLVQLLLDRGDYLLNLGLGQAAAPLLEEGQKLAPDDYHFPLYLARIAATDRKKKRARELLERALTLGADRPFVYLQVIEVWTVLDAIDEARAVLARAEAALPLASDFYVDVGLLLLRRLPSGPSLSLKPASQPPDSPWSRLAEELLDRATAMEPEESRVPARIAMDLVRSRPDLALRYAQEAARRAPDDPHSLMVLGLVQALSDAKREARETLRRAATLARRQGDRAFERDIERLRMHVDSPFLSLMLDMGPLLDDLDLDDDPFF